jgi:hypothetical protein
MNYLKTLAVVSALALLTTGAVAQTTVLSEVGPDTRPLKASDYVGTLVVYSATDRDPEGKDTVYYSHTSYEVYRDGRPFRHVYNGHSLALENPTRVSLPKGDYVVVAQSATQGTVKVPVKIETGRTTVLHLDGN